MPRWASALLHLGQAVWGHGGHEGSPADQEVYGEGQVSAMATAPGGRLWPLVWKSLARPSESAPQKPQVHLRCCLQRKPGRWKPAKGDTAGTGGPPKLLEAGDATGVVGG